MFEIFVCFSVFIFLVAMFGVTAFSENDSVRQILWKTTKITAAIVGLIFAFVVVLL